jgi:ankyrin repeat protein
MAYTPNYIHCAEIAHYSVTEYLNSSQILNTPAFMFYISNKSAAEDIVQKCLSYITDYSLSNRKKESQQDLEEFPLLQYASHFWHKQLLANEDMITSETKGLVFDFLASKTSLISWLLVYHPDEPYNLPFSRDINNTAIATPLYYAIELGIRSLVTYFIDIGADAYAVGEGSCNAAASATLNSDVRGGCGSALEASVWSVNTEILQLLLEAEANVNAQDGDYGAAIHAASMLGHLEFVALLIKAGANVNADTEKYGTPLEAAFQCGLGDAEDHIDVIELLLAAGADPGILSSEEIELIQDTRTLKKLLAAGIDRTMIIDEVFEKFREPIKGWPSG